MKDAKSRTALGLQFMRSSFWSLLQNGGTEVTSFLVFLVLARLLTPGMFGLVALAGVYMMVMQVFIDQGFHTAIIQRQDLEPEHLNTAFWMNMSVALCWAALSSMGAPVIATLFGHPDLAPIIRVLSVNFILAALCMVPLALLKRQLRFKELALRNVLSNGIGGICGIVMAFKGCGVWSLVGQQVSGYVVGMLLLWHLGGWRPRCMFSWFHFRQLFIFGFHISGGTLVQVVSARTDQYLIGRFLGAELLGIYAVAGRVQLLLNRIFVVSIGDVSNTVFSRLQNEPQRLAAAYYRCVRFLCMLALPGFLIFMIFASDVFAVFFGGKWQACVPFVQVLTLSGLLGTVYGVNQPVMRAMGRPDLLFGWLLLNTILNVGIFFLMLPRGLYAVVWGFAARAYLMAPLELFIIRKLIPVGIMRLLRENSPLMLASLLMALVLLLTKYFNLLPAQPWLRLPCGAVFGVLLYGLLLQILTPASVLDFRDLLERLIRRREIAEEESAI